MILKRWCCACTSTPLLQEKVRPLGYSASQGNTQGPKLQGRAHSQVLFLPCSAWHNNVAYVAENLVMAI